MPVDSATEPRTSRSALVRVLAWSAFAVAVAINLYGLYAPSQPGPSMFPGFDKIAHAGSFALVMLTGLLAGLPPRPLAVVLAAHAVASEILQATVLPDRSGDPLDVLADVAGVLVGWLVWRAWTARRSRPRGGSRV